MSLTNYLFYTSLHSSGRSKSIQHLFFFILFLYLSGLEVVGSASYPGFFPNEVLSQAQRTVINSILSPTLDRSFHTEGKTKPATGFLGGNLIDSFQDYQPSKDAGVCGKFAV